MNTRTAVCAACAVVAGWMLLPGCASAPSSQTAAAPAMMDIAQVPGLGSMLYVSESASVTRPQQAAPSSEDLARVAAQQQTAGMAPGAVTGGPKDQIVISIPESSEPEAARPVLVIPSLQPEAESRPPEEEKSWKKPLPPLRNLEEQ